MFVCLCVCVVVCRRLSPEFYDSIIRLPIPINNDCVLMIIGVLPMHPSPHVSFVRWWLVDGIGGWFVWLISRLDEVGHSLCGDMEWFVLMSN